MKQLMALFMIVLVLSMSPTFAAQISSITVQSQPPIKDNFVVAGENATIYVDINETNADTAQEQVKWGANLDNAFDDCYTYGGQIRCQWFWENVPIVNNNNVANSRFSISARIGSDDTTKKTQEVYIDSQAPVIQSIQTTELGSTLNVSFTITDSIFGTYSVCSGIKTVKIQLEGGENKTFTPQTDDCEINGWVEIPKPPGLEQSVSLTVIAYDYFDHETSLSKFVFLDTKEAELSGFQLRNAVTSQVRFISQFGSTAFIQVNSTDPDVTANVTFDGRTEPMTCTYKTCVSDPIEFTEPKQYSFLVQAQDDAGNLATVSQSVTLSYDVISPRVTSAISSDKAGDINYLTNRSNITITFEETGVGFHLEDVQASIQGRNLPLIGCEEGWTCTFESISNLEDGEYPLTISGNDDLVNPIVMEPVSLIVDTTAPSVTTPVSVVGLSQSGEQPYVVAGGRAKVTFNVTDESPVSASVNFSNFGASTITENCEGSYCEILSDTISQGGVQRTVQITLTDAAGNTFVGSTDSFLSLATAQNETDAFGVKSITLQPDSFEVSTAEYINQYSYGKIVLEPKANAEILSSDFVVCESQDPQMQDVNFFKRIEEFANGNETIVLIYFPLQAVDISNKTSFDLSCDIRITGRQDTTFIPEEVESFNISFNTYGFELGTLDDKYYEEYERSLDKIRNHRATKLEGLNNLVEQAGKLCQMYHAINTIFSSIAGVLNLLGVEFEFLKLSYPPFTVPAGEAGEAATRVSCWSVASAKITISATLDAIFTIGCAIASCQFSITSFAADMVSSGGDLGALKAEGATREDPLGTWSGYVKQQTGIADSVWNKAGGPDFVSFESSNSVKDNLYLSYLNLCIPGIVHNLEKERQIYCEYSLCLRDSVPAGVSMEACKSVRDYARCVFVTGGVLSALFGFIDNWVNQIKAFLLNPFGLALTIAKYVACGETCTMDAIPGTACKIAMIAELAGKFMGALDAFKSTDWDVAGHDYCAELEGDLNPVEASG